MVASPLDSSQDAALIASTSTEKAPSATRSDGEADPPLSASARSSLFSLWLNPSINALSI